MTQILLVGNEVIKCGLILSRCECVQLNAECNIFTKSLSCLSEVLFNAYNVFDTPVGSYLYFRSALKFEILLMLF